MDNTEYFNAVAGEWDDLRSCMFQDEHHDRWLGFKPEDVRRWFAEAGLRDIAVVRTGQDCRATSASHSETSAIRIFAASGRKQGETCA